MGKPEKLNLEDIDIYRVLASMHEGVVISDAAGKVRYYNQTQAKIDDIDPDDAIGKKVTDIYKLTDDTSPIMRCLKSGRAILNETLVYQTRLGKVANILSHVYPLYKSGNLIGAINFSKDYQLLEKIVIRDPDETKHRADRSGARYKFDDIIGVEPEILNAVRVARISSNSPSPIMIYGETGTGKELFAQSIHNHSSRSKKSFIPVNCAAIPENLLEGILFGTSKGAFTGALDKGGLFEQANGGSIFLDELDSMPLTLQAKLLRVIQEKKVRKLGSLKEIDLDVKMISSVGQPPVEIIRKGILRMDLFYRMGVVSIMLPPLRDRENDMNELIARFIKKFNVKLNEQVARISDNVLKLFGSYRWPGNVRELEHIIEAAMNMVAGDRIIRRKHLPPHIFSFSGGGRQASGGLSMPTSYGDSRPPCANLVENQAQSEKQMICTALEKSMGNAAKAARAIGISPQSFHYKLKKHKVSRQDFVRKILQ